jgi:hypothetical protein
MGGMNGTNDPSMTAQRCWCMIFSQLSRRDHWGGELCGGTYDGIGAVALQFGGDGSRPPWRAGPGPGRDNNNNIFRALFLTGRGQRSNRLRKEDTLHPHIFLGPGSMAATPHHVTGTYRPNVRRKADNDRWLARAVSVSRAIAVRKD